MMKESSTALQSRSNLGSESFVPFYDSFFRRVSTSLPFPPYHSASHLSSTLTNTGYNYASLPQHSPDAPGSQPGTVPYYGVSSTPAPPTMSPAPLSNISYTSPQTYPTQPSQYSGPGSDVGGPTVYSESNSGYGAVPTTVTYGVANPGPVQQYPVGDPNQYSPGATPYNPYSNPAAAYQQPAPANPLLEGFDGGMHAPPPRYETPAPGSSLMGPGATGATGWPNEKR